MGRRRRRCFYDVFLVYFTTLAVLFFGQTSGGRRSPLFTFTKSSYVATIPENARGKVYANSDSKMGVYVPYFSSVVVGSRTKASATDVKTSSSEDGGKGGENSVRYKIVNGDKQNFFKAESDLVGNFAFLRIRTRPSLDLSLNRELTPEFSLRIKATLRRPNERNLETWTEVLIKVLDQNDLAPLFIPEFQSVEIPEDFQLFSTVTQVVATDPDDGMNGEIYYSLPERNHYFAVNPNTGVISLIKKITSDTSRSFTLKILAEDRASRLFADQKSGKLPSVATVNVTIKAVNHYAPILTVVEINNDATSNSTVGDCGVGPSSQRCALLRASDLDDGIHGKIKTVDIISGVNRHWFVVNRVDDDLYEIRSLGEISSGIYDLIVAVTDDGYPPKNSTSNVAIIVNERCPALNATKNRYKFMVDECSVRGTVVGLLGNASDVEMSWRLTTSWSVPFKINEKSGVLTLVDHLDFETTSKYQLEVVATNEKCKFTFDFHVEIDVVDCNNNAPKFDDFLCSEIWIRPDTPLETVLCTVKASDSDNGANGKISYSIRSNNKNVTKLFWIDPFNGILKLRSPVPDEFWRTNEEMVLKIKASDWGFPYRRETELSSFLWFGSEEKRMKHEKPIVETPENRFDPIFDVDLAQTFYVNENATVGSVVFSIKAKDADLGAAGFVRYGIIDGNDDGFWTIDSENGDVRPLKILNREKLPKFSLSIEAMDSGTPPKFVSKTFAIELTDCNDEKPKFLQQFYIVHVREDAKIGSVVGHFKATDDDEGENARVSYSLSPESSIFVIETDTGVVTLKQTLNRETRAEYTLTVVAVDHGRPPLSSSSVVKMVVDDVNDNPPTCYLKNQKYQLAEDLPINSLVTCVDAYDPDLGAGGRVTFRLSETHDSFNSPKAASKFSIEPDCGCIWLKAKLDYEERPLYNLSVELTDAGQPQFSTYCSLLIEIINVNENRYPPLFDHFALEKTVYENEPEYTLVAEVRAKDPDQSSQEGLISYSIVDGDGLGFFSIDGSGKIRTSRKLDRETKSFYWLTLVARDHGVVSLSSSIELFVRVLDRNDNAPIPSRPFFSGSIKENSPPNTVVVRVEANDPDLDNDDDDDDLDGGGRLTFKINQGDPQSFFKIDSKTGYISTDKRQLDRESVENFELEVAIVDSGTPHLTSLISVIINVEDENDCPPKFLSRFNEFQAVETSDERKEIFLCRIYAVDLDSPSSSYLRYNISEGNEDGRFWIDQETGEIYTSSKLKPRETIALTVSVFDGKFRDDTSVVFNVINKPDVPNNKPPIVSNTHNVSIHISANEPLGRSIGLLEATDPDGDALWYYLDDKDNDKIFALKPDSGDLQLAQKPNLSVYQLSYVVTDALHFVLGKVIIYVENIPEDSIEFNKESYTVDVYENATIGFVIFELAPEIRNGNIDVRYFLNTDFSAGNSKFEVDARSGNVYLTEQLDRETTKSYVLMVEARNKRQKIFSLIHVEVIDVNDHKPKFVTNYQEARVQETALVDSIVIHMLAVDEDAGDAGRLSYKIVSGNELSFFAIDPTNGVVTVAKPLNAVYPEFVLSVKVEDSGTPSQSDTAALRILLMASIQNYVKFQQDVYTVQLPENQRVGSVVGSVFIETGAPVVYSLEDSTGLFEINPTSGVIILIGRLDFETSRHLEMLVRAKGAAGGEDVARFVVKVSDSNDHAPIFKRPLYEGIIVENAPVGSVVLDKEQRDVPLTIVGMDVDTGPAGLVCYRITDAWASNFFEIDYRTGAIRTKIRTDYEKQKVYEFSVMAEDMGEPKMYSIVPTLVRISVENVNDNAPQFEKSEYSATVLLPTANGATVVDVKATDPDGLDALTYSLTNYKDKFFVVENFGRVKIRNSSLLTIGQSYDLTLTASDGLFSASTRIKIETKFASAHDEFRCASDEYFVNVLENLSSRQTILLLQTIGSSLGESVLFNLVNENKWFTLNPFTGLLEATGEPLDREEHENGRLTLVVHAYDQRNPPRLARCVVEINILDQNDRAPEFVNEPYSFVIATETPGNTVVGKIKAVDLDDVENGRVGYKFGRLDETSAQFVDKYLNLNASSGELSLKQNFSYDLSQNHFAFSIVAYDHGSPSLSSLTTVTVTTVGKGTPVFEQSSYNVSVSEGDVGVRKTLIKLAAKSKHENVLGYRLVDGDVDSLFWVNFLTGELMVQKPLDRELNPSHRLKLQSIDVFVNATSEVFVNVEVLDVNDNVPTFDERIYTFDVKENALIGAKFGAVRAVDNDIGDNAVLVYSLDSAINKFEINRNTGELTLVSPLDFESSQKFSFDVTVHDSGLPTLSSTSKVIVNVVDVNDNPPKFTQLAYESVLVKSLPMDSFVGQVSATDEDRIDGSRLIYSIFDGDDEQLFALDSRTGVVKTAKLLDGAIKSKYLLNLTVTDGLYSSSCQLSVKLDAPSSRNVFAKRTFDASVKENVEKGHLVGSADVQSSTLLTYRLLNGGYPFGIDAVTGNVYVNDLLDAERKKFYVMTILADDAGGATYAAQMKVSVLDVNDNKPKFAAQSYKISIPADLPVGTMILQVFADDADENDFAEYSLRKDSDGDIAEKYFKINSQNGKLETKRDLKDYSGRHIRFVIIATDQGNPPLSSEVAVEIDVTTSKNKWINFSPDTEYSFRVAENVNTGYKIGRVRLNGVTKSTLTVLSSSDDQSNAPVDMPFVLDVNGTITVVGPLDYEKRSKYSFHVGASSSENVGGGNVFSALALVHVKIDDSNDNPPKFFAPQLALNVFEDAPVGTSVVVVSADDADSKLIPTSSLRYSIGDTDDKHLFKIDSHSGWILTAASLDRESKDLHRIKIAVSDEGQPSRQSEILLEIRVLDVNDVSPKFEKEAYEFTVSENASPGTVVGTLRAFDNDLPPYNATSFYIVDGNTEGLFGVHSNGQIYVARSLDFEMARLHRLVVLVFDGKFSDMALVLVNVDEEDDNSPVCGRAFSTISVVENGDIGTVVYNVEAMDLDVVENAVLRYSLIGSDDFEILMDGKVVVRRKLDREKHPSYNLMAKAEDGGGRFCEIRLLIIVTDANDEAPLFQQKFYRNAIAENFVGKFPQFIQQVVALDYDLGNGSQVAYYFDSTVDKSKFSLDNKSGAIFVLQPLDREEIAEYNLTVFARDAAQPSLSGSTQVLIDVLDINDNPPEFLQTVYSVDVGEDAPIGVEILRVKALSRDSGRNAEIRYHLSGENMEHFSLDETTGSITVKRNLDYEQMTEYQLVVIGVDGGEPPLSGSTTINVFVKDVNDNAPVFTEEIYRVKVLENQSIGQTLVKVSAHDRDSGENGHVSYEIVASRNNEASLFNISSDGRLMLSSQLDYELKKTHIVELKVFDFGSPQLSSIARVHVDVMDVNDNAPQINNCNRTITIKQQVKSETTIHTFNTIDRDTDVNGPPFSYHLSGDGSQDFKVTSAGHLQTVVSPLTALQYKLKITVSDAGQPILSSACQLTVKIIEESRYAPEITPFHTTLMTYIGEFHGGLVGKVSARDRDAQDHLIYGIHTLDDDNKELFDVHSEDGRVSASAGLKSDDYVLNVTVFDGSYLSYATSKIEVKTITTDMLSASVSIKLNDVDVRTFVHSKITSFVRTTANLLGVRPQFVHLLSVQPVEKNAAAIDVLFAVRKSRQEFHKPSFIRGTLASKLDEFNSISLKSELATEMCRNDSCLHGDCRDFLTVDEVNLVAIITERINFVSPKHRRTHECICKEGYGGMSCDMTINACGSKPCPSEQLCIPDESPDGYHCSCPPGRQGSDCRQLTCSHLSCSDTAVNFGGKSFVRYTLSESLETDMDFDLQFRTTSPFGTLMFSSGKTDFQMLEIHGGLVQYRFDLGSGENIVRISHVTVSDGQWHAVKISRREKRSELTLDKKFTTKFEAPGVSNVLNLHGAHFYLGAELLSGVTSAPTIRSGYAGCIQTAELNGYRLPLTGPGVLLHNVRFECQLDALVAVCRNSPCRNGGRCSAKGSSYVCACSARYSGRHCEIDTDPCQSSPCVNGGTCENTYNDFVCKCPAGFSGKTCQIKNEVDACVGLPCANGGLCITLPNGFLCNCSVGWTGPLCTNDLLTPNISSSSWGVTWIELIGIIVLLLVLIILTIVIVFLCRKRHRYRYKKANYIQNVPNDEITCDILQPHPSCQSQSNTPSQLPPATFVRGAATREIPPPLPPRLRSFVPHRGSKLSNLEAALSTGIPTVQVRPLSMSERQATPPPGGLLESVANYGSAAEELERLGRGPEADVEENVDDWKAALQFVNFNDDSLERLKAVASSLESPARRPKKRANNVDPLAAPSVTSIQCLPEDEQMSAYHWDYSDWNSTLGQPGGYNTLSRSEILTDDETGAVGTNSLPRGISKLEETDTESVDGATHENELNELEEAAAGMDEFRQQLLALSRLNRRLDGDEYNNSSAKSSKGGGGGSSYLDRYLPRLQPPMSTGSERRRLLDGNDSKLLNNNHERIRDIDASDEYESEWSLPTAAATTDDDDRMQTSMEGQLSSTAPHSTNDLSAVCEIDDDSLSLSDASYRHANSAERVSSPASIKKQTEV